jgi:hypothetical protein
VYVDSQDREQRFLCSCAMAWAGAELAAVVGNESLEDLEDMGYIDDLLAGLVEAADDK